MKLILNGNFVKDINEQKDIIREDKILIKKLQDLKGVIEKTYQYLNAFELNRSQILKLVSDDIQAMKNTVQFEEKQLQFMEKDKVKWRQGVGKQEVWKW